MGKRGKNFKVNKKQLKFEQKVLRCFKKKPSSSLNYKQLGSLLGFSDHYELERIQQSLEKLLLKGQIIELSTGKYKLNIRDEVWEGRIIASKFGRLAFKDDETGEYFSIKSRDYGHALDGDKVSCKIYRDGRKKKRFARIQNIIERSRTIFVGRVQKVDSFAFVIPIDKKVHVDFFVKNIPIDVEDGCIVKIKLLEWRSNDKSPRAEIEEVIGVVGSIDVEMRSILIEKGFELNFSKKALSSMDDINIEISSDEEKVRRDFRDVTTFTIDPVDAKDFDDALSIKMLDNGAWEIGIHIADVTHYLEEGSELDKEAFKRSTSVYLTDRVLPMLPEKLSNHWCSLVPHETRRCYSAVFIIDADATVQEEWFGRTLIHSDHRFNYQEAQEVLDKGEGVFVDELRILNRVAQKFRKKRLKNGAIAFESNEVRFEFDKQGRPNKINLKERIGTHKLIEEFMLLANRKVAAFLRTSDTHDHNVYRVHDLPDEEKIFELISFAKKFDLNISYQTPRQFALELNAMMKKLGEGVEARIMQQMAVRSMAKAVYTSKNIGHYGLAFENYTHFTSPIRRYADVIVHRKLSSVLNKKIRFNKFELEDKCEHISRQEKKAMEAERIANKFMKVLYMEDKVGEVFDGIISGMMDWGFFVEIPENTCEGGVRIKELSEMFYLDPLEQSFTSHETGKKFQLGDSVKVKVKSVNLDQRIIDFSLI